MSDRRTVDELTIEELEQVLIVRRQEARAERMRRLREIGRLPAEAALPNEDLADIGQSKSPSSARSYPGSSRRDAFKVEPVRRMKGLRQRLRRLRSLRSRSLRDRLLLGLEVGALLGLVAILVVSVSNLRSLNSEYAEASLLPATAPAKPTALAGGILPGGHAPPEEPGTIPVHLRGLVEGEAPIAVPIATPGPEAPTHIVIPAINVDALIVEGDTPEQLKLGVGHMVGSANPGERGNMVLSAHNDIYGEIFRHLSDLELGDEVAVYSDEQPYRYVVTAKRIVEPTEVSVLAPTTKPVVTLISCYPYMVDTHRIIIVAELQ
jgi:sortase A